MNLTPFATNSRALVVDANILVRAVLGRRVMLLLEAYVSSVNFVAPEIAFASARTHLPRIMAQRQPAPRHLNHLVETEALERLPWFVNPVDQEVYVDLESEARRRIAKRDEADWPFVALALKLRCPIWTEDRDFFGTGVPTWTTDRIEIYLESESQ